MDGDSHFESTPSVLQTDFTSIEDHVYPPPGLPTQATHARLREQHEEVLAWFSTAPRQDEERRVKSQHSHAFVIKNPRIEDDEYAFQEPLRQCDDAIRTLGTIGEKNVIDTVSAMCAKNNQNVYTFRSFDVRNCYEAFARLQRGEELEEEGEEEELDEEQEADLEEQREMTEQQCYLKMPPQADGEPGVGLEKWVWENPKTVLLFPQHLPSRVMRNLPGDAVGAGPQRIPGHHWLAVYDCDAGQLYILDSLARLQGDDPSSTTSISAEDRDAVDERLAVVLQKSRQMVNFRTPDIFTRFSLQSGPDEAVSVLYVCRWIQLFNERYYRPFLDMNYPHDKIFSRQQRRLDLSIKHQDQPSPASFFSAPQWHPVEFSPLQNKADVDEMVEPGSYPIREIKHVDNAGAAAGPGNRSRDQDIQEYRTWLHKQLHKVNACFREQYAAAPGIHMSDEDATALAADLLALKRHLRTAAARHWIANESAVGVVIRLPDNNNDPCGTGDSRLNDCCIRVIPLKRGSKVVLGDISTRYHYNPQAFMSPVDPQGQQKFRRDPSKEPLYATNVEKAMIMVTQDGHPYARSMTRGSHQDAQGDQDAYFAATADPNLRHHLAGRPEGWNCRATVNGFDFRRLPAVRLPCAARICINGCTWIWVSPNLPDYPDTPVPPELPATVCFGFLRALVQELRTEIEPVARDPSGHQALQAIEEYIQDYELNGLYDDHMVQDLCLSITHLRNEQRIGLVDQFNGNSSAMNLNAHWFDKGPRAPPTHRKPPRPAWQRLLGGADAPRAPPHPQTKMGYYGPMEWRGGRYLIDRASPLEDYTAEGADKQLDRITNLNLLQLFRGEIAKKLDVVVFGATDKNLDMTNFTEPLEGAGQAERQFNFETAIPDAELIWSDQTMQFWTWYSLFDRLATLPGEQKENDELDCVVMGMGDHLQSFASGFGPAVMSDLYSSWATVELPKEIPANGDYLRMCVRKRYWVFTFGNLQPAISYYPRVINFKENGITIANPLKKGLGPTTIRYVPPENLSKKEKRGHQWPWKGFCAEVTKQTGWVIGPKGATGYTVDWTAVTKGPEQKFLSEAARGPIWYPLANAYDFSVLVCHANVTATLRQPIIHLHKAQPKGSSTIGGPNINYQNVAAWDMYDGSRENTHWMLGIYDSAVGRLYIHDTRPAIGVPGEGMRAFHTSITTFIWKYDWKVLNALHGRPEGLAGPVAPENENFARHVRGGAQQTKGFSCGDLSLAGAVNFFLNYRRRAANEGGTPDVPVLHADFIRGARENQTVIYMRNFYALVQQERQDGLDPNKVKPIPDDEVEAKAPVQASTENVLWHGQDDPVQGRNLDMIFNSYQQANKNLLVGGLSICNNGLRRVTWMLREAGAVLFSIAATEAAECGETDELPCHHQVDVLPVPPGYCVILTEDAIEPERGEWTRAAADLQREKLRERNAHLVLVGNHGPAGIAVYNRGFWGTLNEAQNSSAKYEIPVMINFIDMLAHDDNNCVHLPDVSYIRVGGRFWFWLHAAKTGIDAKRKVPANEAQLLGNVNARPGVMRNQHMRANDILNAWVRYITEDDLWDVYCDLLGLTIGTDGIKRSRTPEVAVARRSRKGTKSSQPKPPGETAVQRAGRERKERELRNAMTQENSGPVVDEVDAGENSAKPSSFAPVIVQRTVELEETMNYRRANQFYNSEAGQAALAERQAAFIQRGNNRRAMFAEKRRIIAGAHALDEKSKDLSDYNSDDSVDRNLERYQPFGIRPRRRLRKDPHWTGRAADRPSLYEYSSDEDLQDGQDTQNENINQRSVARKRRRLAMAGRQTALDAFAERDQPVLDMVRRNNWVNLAAATMMPQRVTRDEMRTQVELQTRAIADLRNELRVNRMNHAKALQKKGKRGKEDTRANVDAQKLRDDLIMERIKHARTQLKGGNVGKTTSKTTTTTTTTTRGSNILDRMEIERLKGMVQEHQATLDELNAIVEEQKKIAAEKGVEMSPDLLARQKAAEEKAAQLRAKMEEMNTANKKSEEAIRLTAKQFALENRRQRRLQKKAEMKEKRARVAKSIEDGEIQTHLAGANDEAYVAHIAAVAGHVKGSWKVVCPVCGTSGNANSKYQNHLRGKAAPGKADCGLTDITHFLPKDTFVEQTGINNRNAALALAKNPPDKQELYDNWQTLIAAAQAIPEAVQTKIDEAIGEKVAEGESDHESLASNYTEKDDEFINAARDLAGLPPAE